jgi:replicative DNA helicase
LANRQNVSGVFLDYLQIVAPPTGRRFDRRDIEVTTVGYRLKALAETLSAPVIAGAQINRDAIPDKYGRSLAGKSYEDAKKVIRTARPQLHQLREGGAEQPADLVLGLLSFAADYQAEADVDSSEDRRNTQVPDATCLEVGVLKQRDGPTGRWAALAFEGRFKLIRDRNPGEGL